MLEKITSKVKSAFHGKKDADLAQPLPENLNSLEKAQAFLTAVETQERALRDTQSGSPRHALLRRQVDQLAAIVSKFRISDDMDRIAALFASDQDALTAALKDAQASEATAAQAVKNEEEKHAVIEGRLAPLTAKRQQQQAEAAAAFLLAKAEFEAAIASGDDSAEALAAEKLSKAQTAPNVDTEGASPTGLRIAALTKELEASAGRLAGAQAVLDGATQATLVAVANLAMLEYDRAARQLFDSYVKQWAAVRACGQNSKFASKPVNDFGAGVSHRARFVFPGQDDPYGNGYNNGYMSARIVADVAIAIAKVPDLALLAKDAALEPLNEAEPLNPEAHSDTHILDRDTVVAG